jgi:hypothetical protein
MLVTWQNGLQPGGRLGALFDGALGIQLGGERRSVDNERANPGAPQWILQVARAKWLTCMCNV